MMFQKQLGNLGLVSAACAKPLLFLGMHSSAEAGKNPEIIREELFLGEAVVAVLCFGHFPFSLDRSSAGCEEQPGSAPSWTSPVLMSCSALLWASPAAEQSENML